MAVITPFSRLSASFRACEAQLRSAILAHDTTRAHASLLRQTASLMEEIGTIEPSSVPELEEMIDFFASRRVDVAGDRASEFDRVAELVTRYRESDLPADVPPPGRLSAPPEEMPTELHGCDLARLVTESAGRLSALSAEARYLAVSASEAAFHRTTPGRMTGKHILQVIGCGHDQIRMKQRLDLAFDGRPQDFVTAQSGGNGGQSLVRTRIVRVTDPAGNIYASLVHAAPLTDTDAQDGLGSAVA